MKLLRELFLLLREYLIELDARRNLKRYWSAIMLLLIAGTLVGCKDGTRLVPSYKCVNGEAWIMGGEYNPPGIWTRMYEKADDDTSFWSHNKPVIRKPCLPEPK